jgi:pimeloyl-ACP methyl ester carboxylesterase
VEPLVLVCGLGQSRESWDVDWVPALEGAGFTVVTVDVPKASDVDRMAEDVAARIASLGLGPCHVAGYSLGSWIVETLAGTRPELVRSVTCVAGLNETTEWEKVECEHGRDLAALGVPLPRFQALFEELVYLPRSDLQDDERMRALLAEPREPNPDALGQWEAALRWTQRTDAVARWSRIAVPCLAVTYTDDIDSPPAHTRRAAEHVPDIQVVELPGTHLTPIDSPHETLATLQHFFRSCSNPSS